MGERSLWSIEVLEWLQEDFWSNCKKGQVDVLLFQHIYAFWEIGCKVVWEFLVLMGQNNGVYPGCLLRERVTNLSVSSDILHFSNQFKGSRGWTLSSSRILYSLLGCFKKKNPSDCWESWIKNKIVLMRVQILQIKPGPQGNSDLQLLTKK